MVKVEYIGGRKESFEYGGAVTGRAYVFQRPIFKADMAEEDLYTLDPAEFKIGGNKKDKPVEEDKPKKKTGKKRVI